MRDNSEGMPELIEANAEPEGFFGIIRCRDETGKRSYRIGLQEYEYKAWRKVLTTRPFDRMSMEPCRYFFAGAGRHSDRKTYATFRIEQGSEGRQFDIDLPEHAVANLVWFFQLKDPKDADHLLYDTRNTESGRRRD
jgi:hypothetical protein